MPDSVNEQHHFAPHDVAGMFDLSVMTVRRWADYHKAHLSESANPSPGGKRSFTWADVEKFRQIKAWRDAGLTVDAINSRLSGVITEAISATTTPVSELAPPALQESPQQAPGALVALDAINTLQRQIDGIQDRQRDGVVMFGIGFIAALLFVLLIIGIAVLYGGFR